MPNHKWIEFAFVQMSDSGKTTVHEVRVINTGLSLGLIKWHAQWRKYSFFPAGHTIFEKDCLLDIVEFLNSLTTQRSQDLKDRRAFNKLSDAGDPIVAGIVQKMYGNSESE
jgi:hypothetical protein